ncbi:uncharacterized protein LOC123259839 isoform X2 [Cotesia glomerata]|uniref:Uncharacterized protein n=1 Tax=Cotesia glomerata TaxID=32391 RepID=A0AAV7J3N1_COTGL|nr:uncharacterized protein LOC123259839 isoform X2 [Cotesia glomerata]KAH0567400.1 hypothetical protein KQX54_009525 [Cotesia glomerata]
MMFNHIVLIVISFAVAELAIGESAAMNSEVGPIHDVEPEFSPIVKRNSLSERSCGTTMPCGWLVYNMVEGRKKFTSFLLGSCKCDDGLRCAFGKEKLSTAVYVYYCTNTTATDRLAPDHDIYKPGVELYQLFSYVPRK